MLNIRIRHRCHLAASIVAFWAIVVGVTSAQNGLDLFVNACQFSGANPQIIWSGHAEYELQVSTPKKSDAEIKDEIAQKVGSLQAVADSQKDRQTRAHIESIVKLMPATISARNTGVHRSRIGLLFNGNSFSGKRRYEVANFDLATEKWEKPTVSIRANAQRESGTNALWDESAAMATVSSSNFGAPEFQEFGRIRGPYSRLVIAALTEGGTDSSGELSPDIISKFKRELVKNAKSGASVPFSVVGESKYDGNSVASIVETRIKNSRSQEIVSQRYWIDQARGYVCPLVQLFDKSGKLAMEWKSSNYFLDRQSGLWFPENHTYTEFEPDSGKAHKVQQFHVDRNGFWFNRTVADSEFAIELPQNAKVMDARHTPPLMYTSGKRVTLTLENIDGDLGKVLESGPGKVFEAPTLAKQMDLRRSLLIVFNIIVVTALLLFIIFRNRRRSNALMLLIVTTSLCGCSKSSIDSSYKSHPAVVVVPSTVNFGQVREDTENLQLSFTIKNVCTESVRISQIVSACGCTAPKLTETTLLPNDIVNVPLSVRVRDRVGKFSTNVFVYASTSKKPIIVPVQGRIVRDIWCGTPTIRCSVSESDKIARGVFTIHTIDWPDVQFDLERIGKDFSIKEISRSQSMNETLIKFVFTTKIDTGLNAKKTYLNLKPLDGRITPLEIAVICFRVDAGRAPHSLGPERVSIGAVEASGMLQFALFGEPEILSSLMISRVDNVPSGVLVELDAYVPLKGSRTITVKALKTAKNGAFNGAIHFKSSVNQDISVTLLGRVTSKTNRIAEL